VGKDYVRNIRPEFVGYHFFLYFTEILTGIRLDIPPVLHQQMDRLFQINSDLEGVEIDRIKAEWIEWFESTTSVVPDRAAVLKHVFAPALSVSCFFGTLSANTSAQILRHQGQLCPMQDAFILRLSRSKRPYFGLDARFLDVQTSQQVIYNSSILLLTSFCYCYRHARVFLDLPFPDIFFDWDPETRSLGFWLDTERDARPSYSRSLAQVIEYVIRKTSWQPLPLDQARHYFSMGSSSE
jgi:hypothetical protein